MIQHIRHGDVLLTRIATLPEGTIQAHKGSYVLALGEATGHHHRITAERKDDLKVLQREGIIFISLAVPMPLTHEEHKTIEVPAGNWKMTFEVEYDPFMKKMRKVVD